MTTTHSSKFNEFKRALIEAAGEITAITVDTDVETTPNISYLYLRYKGRDSVLFGFSEREIVSEPALIVTLSWVTSEGNLTPVEAAQVTEWLDMEGGELFELLDSMVRVCLEGSADDELLRSTQRAFEVWGSKFNPTPLTQITDPSNIH